MEYTKQTWTAPTGTGLSRYAKSAESASHVTLTLDPENLTNTPTPFTMARMAHMEDGIAKAYDTAPPTPWAQYSGKDIPQLPDNVAGTTYKRDNDWTTTDGWTASGGSISVVNNSLELVSACTSAIGVYKTFTITNKMIVALAKRSNAGRIRVSATIAGVLTDLKTVTVQGDELQLISAIITGSATDVRVYFIDNIAIGTKGTINSLYIGSGAYDRLVFDNSYHYRHLINNAVVPTPQGLYFNGETSYLRSKEMVTLPDVFTFSATVNCAVKSTTQIFFAQGGISPTTIPYIHIFRRTNTDNLIVQVNNGTGYVDAFPANNFFTGLDNTDIKIEISVDFINKTTKVYRNNIQFGSVVSTPTMVKPVADYMFLGRSINTEFLLGYMRNIQLFDTALTDTQRNWLAQGNTPPILYDVTNYEIEGLETLRMSADFTLGTYADCKKLRIANTHATNTITVTLPSGQTYAGAIASFTLKPYEKIEIELFGTEWDEIGNEGIGTITATGSTTADFGRLLCHGQALSRTTYARLFNRIGTSFGAGNGSTTFNLPDCREVALVGAGTNVLNSSQINTHNAMDMASFKDSSSTLHNHIVLDSHPSNGLKIGLEADANFKHFGYNVSGDPYALTLNFGLAYTKKEGLAVVHGKQLAINYQIKY